MLKAYKYRIYPTDQQKVLIQKTFDVCRVVYNLALETKIYAYRSHGVNLSYFTLTTQLKDLKNSNIWMKEIDSQAINATLKNLDAAYKNFFRCGGYPKFKKRGSVHSFQCPHNIRRLDWSKNTLTIPKIKDIPIVLDRKFEGLIKTITIRKTSTGKYYASILVDNKQSLPTKPEICNSIGVDVGIKSFAVTSDGRSFDSTRKLKENLLRLKVLQKRASRKKKGSNNRKKANLKVALLHEKITNQRNDYCHKVTTELVRDSQVDTFVIEDLNVAGMMKNRKLSQAIQDVSFGEFFRQMQYKCDWYGKNLIKIGRFEPSSKMCSDCGKINENLTLADREWTCECGSTHDRDLNAAKNIKRIGLEKYTGRGTTGELVESRRLRRAKKQELNSSHPLNK